MRKREDFPGNAKSRKAVILLIPVLILALGQPLPADSGRDAGNSAERYDSWVRSSVYVSMRDGVRIAVDIFRPARDGKPAEEKLPVVWTLKRYVRAWLQNGKIVGTLAEAGPHMTALLEHGYVLAAADSRGSGASFGTWDGLWTETEAMDGYEITEWLASRPWSNGRIGMIGSSYEGTIQLMIASRKPPHLKAIMPAMTLFDVYDLAYPGGIFRSGLVRDWSESTRALDVTGTPAPVDADQDGTLVREARALRRENRFPFDIVAPLKFRDGVDLRSGLEIYRTWQPAGHVREIRDSGVGVYVIGGWYDAYIRDAFLMSANLGPRFKMIVLDCPHAPADPTIVEEAVGILAAEQLRWFDYWLKGIDNGIMQEPRIRYQTNIEASSRTWRNTDGWPMPGGKTMTFYFASGTSGSGVSAPDGRLTVDPPRDGSGEDVLNADPSATSGRTTRWNNTAGGDFGYSDMASNDGKGLAFTTAPLAGDLEITGHPVLHLWISATGRDADFVAYLEEVDDEGVSRYVSEGCLRASRRALSNPPYANFGLPFHRGAAKDVRPLVPGRLEELVFDLLPVSNVFNRGRRLRVSILRADANNLETIKADPRDVVRIYRNAKAASRLVLPAVVRIPE